MFFPEERRRDEGLGLALVVGLAHHHRVTFNPSTGDIRPRCSRTIREGVLKTIRECWNQPQFFKPTYCARCDGFRIPPRAVQLLYLRNDLKKRLGTLTDEQKVELDEACLAAWRIKSSSYSTAYSFELVGDTLNREHNARIYFGRTEDPRFLPETVASLTRRETDEERRRRVDGEGRLYWACTDFMPSERAPSYELVGDLVTIDHA